MKWLLITRFSIVEEMILAERCNIFVVVHHFTGIWPHTQQQTFHCPSTTHNCLRDRLVFTTYSFISKPLCVDKLWDVTLKASSRICWKDRISNKLVTEKVSRQTDQWRSQVLKSGWGQVVWETKVPSGVQERSPRVGLKAKPPEARYMQTVCSCQMLFYASLLPSLSSISPTPQNNSSDQRESNDPTRPGQGGHVPLHPCPPVAALLNRVTTVVESRNYTVSHTITNAVLLLW